jgi:inner membrane transporter RhtA
MSVNPVMAALAGLVVLGQVLGLHVWLGIALVVVANVITVIAANRRRVGAPTAVKR